MGAFSLIVVINLLNRMSWWLLLLLCLPGIVFCKDFEFTFEVPDNKEQCFYEDIDLNQEVEIEFQVLVGGKNDIDMVIHGPGQTLIQTYRRKQQETYKFKTVDRGQYVFCFNNEFSSFSHKVVYFYLGIGEEETLTEEMAVKATALTQIESSCVSIHESLNAVKDYQTDYRLREYRGRTIAEMLSERVQWWSIGECMALVVLSLSQVLLVRSFFRGKPNRKPPRF